jgi:hypothetical protein
VAQDEELDISRGGPATREQHQPERLPEDQVEQPQQHAGIIPTGHHRWSAAQARLPAPHKVMATFRNLVISLHRLAGATNIAAALRHHARNATRPLQLLMIT